MNKETDKIKNKDLDFYMAKLSNVEELVEMVIASFIYADQLANHLEIDESKFRELYYKEIKRDIETAIERGLCGFIRVEGEIAAFASLIDVADIEIPEPKPAYNSKFEAYERVISSLFMLIKDCQPRNTSMYFQYIVTKNKYANAQMASDIVNAGGRHSFERGIKSFYAIPINQIAESFEKKWTHKVLCEINLDELKFGDSQPFKGIDFKIPLLYFEFEDIKDKLYTKGDFFKPNL